MTSDRAALVHLAAGIGNIVLSTPLLIALDEIGYAVDVVLDADFPETAGLLRDWCVVRRVVDGRVVQFDRYSALVPAIPPFYWLRFEPRYRGRERLVRRPPDALFYTDEQCYYLSFARSLGYPRDRRPAYRLPITADATSPVTRQSLVIAPGCKGGTMAAKRWPYFPELAERFADVLVVGQPADLQRFDGTMMRFPPHVRSLVGALTLRETAKLMAGAAVVVGNDSGLTHVAAAVGTPTIMLFGPTPAATLGPLVPNVKILRTGLPCEPCWFTAQGDACAGRIDCLTRLDVDLVASEVRAFLDGQVLDARAPSAGSARAPQSPLRRGAV